MMLRKMKDSTLCLTFYNPLAKFIIRCLSSLGLLLSLCPLAFADNRQNLDKLQQLEDLAQIRELLTTRYAQAMDARDWNEFALLFAEDGQFVLQPPVGEPLIIKGRKAIAMAFAKVPEGESDLDIMISLKHFITNVDIELAGDQASAALTWLEVQVNKTGSITTPSTGFYEDTLRKVHDEWKITSRTVR